jgi:hypothetical protein
MASERHVPIQLEPPDVDLRAVLLTAAGAIVLVVAAVAGLHAVYRAYVPNRHLPAPQAFSGPQVQPDEANELRRLLGDQRARLAGYAWADHGKGLIKIPIERAMQLIVQKGDHAFDPLAPATPLAGPTAGAQRATTPGQGPPAGPAPPQPATSGAAPADQDGEAKP